MNVYKVIDTKTPYCGGMALVAADNEEDAINIVIANDSNYSVSEKNVFEAIILENVSCNTNKPCLITEEWYYE